MQNNVMHVKSAIEKIGGRSRINLSHNVLTTAKIGQILPIFCQECLPSDSFQVNIGAFSRFAPLSVPSYVKLNCRTLSVFVPYHQVADGVESFMDNQARFKGIVNEIPKVTGANLISFLVGSRSYTKIVTTAEDFRWNAQLYQLTAKGNYAVKVLQLLGYRLPVRTGDDALMEETVSSWSALNALPLLSFFHAYNSYLSYSPLYNTSQLSLILETIKRSPNTSLSANQLRQMFDALLLTYEDSFYSIAWANANSSVSDSTLADYTNYIKQIVSPKQTLDAQGNEYVTAIPQFTETASTTHITAAQVRMLLKFDEMMRRSNYSGSKDIEQLYSKFGIKIDDYKSRYPYFLGETAQQVKIGDVTSTSDTEAAPIGAYAGKAIGDAGAGFKFESHDYGMLFTFLWYAPVISYFQGLDPENLRIEPLDFYNPELDNGVAAAIDERLICADKVNTNENELFGYSPLYSEYLFKNDKITGDFCRFTGFNAWHFGRVDVDCDTVAQDNALIYMPNDGTQFERIFHVENTELVDADTIYVTANVDEKAVRPMKDFSGKADLGDGNLTLAVNGTQIS